MVLSMCQTNCYFVSPENQKEVVLIDPADQGGQIYEALKDVYKRQIFARCCSFSLCCTSLSIS